MDSIDLPNAFGFLDAVEESDSGLIISGWMLHPDGPFDRFEIVSEDLTVRTRRSTDRPDVGAQNATIPRAAQSGFLFECTLAGGAAVFTVVGYRGHRPAGKITGGYHRVREVREVPPLHLIKRVSGVESLNAFHASGLKAFHDFRGYLQRHLGADELRRLLDWGCGCGRLSLHLAEHLEGVEIHGTDIDAEAIAWAERAIPGARFQTSGREPPLPFADAHFDAVIATSVFTHLTGEDQVMWLREMRRILRPGGVLLATTQGEFFARYYRPGNEVLEAMAQRGFWDGPLDHLAGVAPDGYYRSTYQTRDYTEEVWSKELEILEYVEAGNLNRQDVFLLRRSTGSASA